MVYPQQYSPGLRPGYCYLYDKFYYSFAGGIFGNGGASSCSIACIWVSIICPRGEGGGRINGGAPSCSSMYSERGDSRGGSIRIGPSSAISGIPFLFKSISGNI